MATHKTYFKNFDALRFAAASIVICAHYVTTFGDSQRLSKWSRIALTLDGSGAEIGVSFFFVLSGFLITYLMLTDRVSSPLKYIKKFYLRRVLRIWPLYFLSIAIGFILFPIIAKISNYIEQASVGMYVFFLANFDQIYFWNSSIPNALLGVHWSVAIEEQFYLLWPWVFVLFRNRFLTISILICISSLAFQSFFGFPSHTISSFQDLASGAIVAILSLQHKKWLIEKFALISKIAIVSLYIVSACLLLARYQLTIHFKYYEILYRPIQDIIFCFIILDQGFNGNTPFQLYRIPFASYLGKISYGLYLLHPLAILLVNSYVANFIPRFFTLPLILLLSITFAGLSYQYYESIFLRLKAKYS